APDSRPVIIPDWVAGQFNHEQTVRIYNQDGYELPLDVYGKLINGYLQSEELTAGISFADYFVKRIASSLN
ncbi:hypothetical protein K0U00_18850, partial [Paenibacillus sepulcri]|nr:hypothetical protein [Paenibacillus sepulcri]